MTSLGVPAFVPPPAYCTDNAAMIGGLASVLLAAGRFSDLAMDAATSSAIGALPTMTP